MSNELVQFTYEGREVRALLIEGMPWLVARDVCTGLGLHNVTEALRGLEEDEKRQVSKGSGILTPSAFDARVNEAWLVNEPGLYSLIMRSRKEEARKFKRWVTHEVLPALRKHGTYTVPGREVEVLVAASAPSVKLVKPESLQLAQYRERARRREARELIARGLDRNPLTGELQVVPGAQQPVPARRLSLADAPDEEVIAFLRREREVRDKARRSDDSAYQTPAEMRKYNGI